MGNCADKGSNDVAGRRAADSEAPDPETPQQQQHADAPQASRRSSQLKLSAAHTPLKRKKHRRGGGNGEATTADAHTPASPHPDASKSAHAASAQSNDGHTPHHHRDHQGKLSETPQLPLHSTASSEGVDRGSPDPSQTQATAYDSIAVRLEQGSTYIWLCNTYGNPYLRPTPLLTFDCVRRLRKESVAFQRLWSVLGEAACVIGPYAANLAPAPPASIAEAAAEEEGEETASDGNEEPSLINDEAPLAWRGRNTRKPNPAATAAGSVSGSASEIKEEVRVLNQQHISIEGEASQQHPIVCRGDVFRGKHVWIHKLRARCCFVLEPLSGVDVHDCSDALIVLAPTAGAVSLSNCRRCLIIAVAAQLRVLSCSCVILSVNVAGFPVIDKSTSIGLAPLLGWYAYSRLPMDFHEANLSLFTNNYSTVRDVTPPTPTNLANSSSLSASGSSAATGNANLKLGNTVLPASNFMYVDLWELEAAVWKAMAEQRWRQLMSDADAAVAATERSSAGGQKSEGAASLSTSRPFLTALTPAQSPLLRASAAAAAATGGGGGNDDDEAFFDGAKGNDKDDAADEEEEEEEERSPDTLKAADPTFHSMISFGHFSPSNMSRTHAKGSSPTTTSEEVSQTRASHTLAPPPRAVPASVLASSVTNDTVPTLPRWRQSGFTGNVATDERPPDTSDPRHPRRTKHDLQRELAQRQRGSAREAEHLVRAALHAIPLLPLSSLRDAPALLLESDTGVVEAKDRGTTAGHAGAAKVAAEKTSERQKIARYNPLELALATYTHACAAPSTFGAQLIPADFFEQAWKLKLMVVTAKGGGFDLSRRIVRDIEGSRRRCFLETVRAMLHAPPPSTRNDADKERGADERDSRSSTSTRDGAAPDVGEEEEDTFSEALWHYLRNTSLTQRCGSVLLLNLVELRCTETAVREFVAPVFYKLCEPVGLKGSSAAATTAAAASGAAGGKGGLHFPWKSGNAHATTSSPSDQQQQHNVEMRRLFGTAIQRMTGQTCVVLLALMAPKNVPQSFQRPPHSGGRSIGGALAPAELDAWAKRADEARHIFSPQKDLNEEQQQQQTQRQEKANGSADEPTAAEGGSGDAATGKRSGPTFAAPDEGEAGPQTQEERVWPQTVLLNVTVPLRFVSLLQGSLFFKSQMHTAPMAGGQQMRAQEAVKKN